MFCCLSFWRKGGASCSILNRCYKVASSQLFLVCVHSFASFRSIVDTYCGRQAEARGIVVFGISLWPSTDAEELFHEGGSPALVAEWHCASLWRRGCCLLLRGQSLRTRFVCARFLCAAEVRCNDGAPRVVRAGRLLRVAVQARRVVHTVQCHGEFCALRCALSHVSPVRL